MAPTYNGRTVVEPRPNGPGNRVDFEHVFKRNLEQRLARTIWVTVLQRDTLKRTAKRTEQSLRVYDLEKNMTNPATDAHFLEELHMKTVSLIKESTAGMSEPGVHLKRMGRILPSLVKALVLDDEYITDIYRPDLFAVAAIAIDWFSHPEHIKNTRIRVGMGGEEVVNGRVPAYIVPALKILSGVQEAFRTYTLWAITDQLHEKLPAGAELIKEWIQQRIKQITKSNEQESIQELPYSQALQILQEGWQHFLGEPLDFAQLQRDYHTTDQIPELVVFNASHAAININRMDSEKVLSVKEKTQELLQKYVERFHPDLASHLTFQNDQHWSEHDFTTKMQILFARDLIRSFDGPRQQAQQKIEEFGRNHQRIQQEAMYTMSSSELYAVLHPFLFEDPPIDVDPTQRMPITNVMQALPVARHVIYHQGASETEFGVFRKLYIQNATVDAFIDWLEKRAQVVSQPLETLASQILHTAHDTVQTTGKPFINILYPLINSLKQQMPEISRILYTYATSDRIKRASNPEKAWAELVQELQEEKPQEELTQLLSLRDRMIEYKKTAEAQKSNIELANLTENKEKLDQLAQEEMTQRMYYPLTHLENIIRVGAGSPVYYMLKGVESSIYPQFEAMSLQKYTVALDTAYTKHQRLKETIALVTKLFSEFSETKHTLPEGFVTPEWQRTWIDQIKNLYLHFDKKRSTEEQVSLEILEQEVVVFRSQLMQELEETVKTDSLRNPELNQYIISALLKKAIEETLLEGVVQIFKLQSVRQDYLLLLHDINPDDPMIAEAEYNTLCASWSGKNC